MAKRQKHGPTGPNHMFGGDWTSTKLAILEKYLRAYAVALKKTHFRKAYIDAFAGTGYRSLASEDHDSALPLFPDLAQEAPQQLLDGSARLALQIEPTFDKYIFVERDPARCEQLRRLGEEFPELRARIHVQHGEANQVIREICDKNWQSHRAVLFLDPYGMQVEWETIEAIARTEAIDLWLLFPLGIGVNRLVTRSGDIPAGWRTRLDTLLGTTDWYDEFYSVEKTPTLFGEDDERVIKASIEVIGRYCNDRLKTVFPNVAAPGVLRNSANCPLYLLCFAVGNPKGADIAVRIASSLLREITEWH